MSVSFVFALSDRLKRRGALRFLLGAFLVSSQFGWAGGGSGGPPEVLIIHSRNPMSTWGRGINEGFAEAFYGQDTLFSIEYLDFRERESTAYRKAFFEYLKFKYIETEDSPVGGRLPSVVVPIGPAAIDFVREFQQRLFPDIPIVFSGPLRTRSATPFRELLANATGTINGADYVGNVRLALRLHPDRPRIFILLENSMEGALQGEFASLQIAAEGVMGSVEILSGSDYTTRSMIDYIKSCEDEAVVIFKSWGIDADGKLLEERYGIDRIKREVAVPVYTLTLSYAQSGVVGGMVVTPQGQANATAEIVKKVLGGEDPGSIEPVLNFRSRPVLFYGELERWAVPESLWPAEAEIRNRPDTIWSQYRWYVILSVLIVISQGIAVACLVFVLSIKRRLEKERRRNEVQLGEANVALAQKNEALAENLDRARQLTQELEIANQAKTEFLSVMSHELRTPLNPIIGYADLLSDELECEHQLEYVRTIRGMGAHLLKMIDSILDFGKASAVSPGAKQEAFLLGEMVEEVAAFFRTKAREKGIELFVAAPSTGDVEVLGDRHAIMQVALNLVANAVKFTAKGSVALRWEMAAGEGGRRSFRLEVEDTGIGIAPAFRDSVFAPFAQQDASLCRKHEGIGLGLAISRKIAENLGGSLSFESEEGKGTVFRFDLSLELASGGREEEGEAALLAAVPGEGVDLSGCRFLIVDDQLDNRALMANILRRQGWQVVEAEDGREAIAAFDKVDFSAILMDLRMPEVSGVEATRVIRKMGQRGRSVPIIAMTANDNPEVRSDCLAAGMNDFVLKPIRVKDTVALVRRWSLEARPNGTFS